MRIGLVSYRCENRNISFNMDQIELAMKRASGKADVLCFSEAFLQGFDSLDEYAVQAASVSDNVFMINPICRNPVNHGGSFFFQKGHVTARIPFDEEGILIAEIP